MVEEYLRQLRQEAGEAKRATPENPDTTPRAQLLALFDIAEGGNARMRGCPFHNAADEAAGVMPGVEHIVHLHKRDYLDGLIHLARQAGAADPEMLGNQVAVLYEGALLCRPRSMIRRPGHGPERRRRPLIRCGCGCQDRVVDRGRRDCDDGFLGATDDI